MTPYQLQPPTRRCARTQRPLLPGDCYVSVLRAEGAALLREEVSAEAWAEPPAGVIAYWPGQVPAAGAAKPPPISDEVLVECFTRLADDPAQANFRYVLALLLMRKKRFRFDEANGAAELVVRDVRGGAKYRVTDPRLTAEQMAQVQDDVFRVLGWA